MAEEREIEAGEGRGEGFLARWSRRKRAAREGLPVEPEPAEPPPAEAPSGTAPPHATEEEPIDLESLPRIEEITAETDISIFFRKGVPAALRNAALRRVWSLDPTIRDFIGPADYAWDWNTPGGVPDFLEGVGETPAIRALVERMLSPSPPVRGEAEAEAEAEAPASLAAAEDHRDLLDPVRPPGAPPPPPLAAQAEPDQPGSTTGDASASAEGTAAAPEAEQSPPPASLPRRHGGALPV